MSAAVTEPLLPSTTPGPTARAVRATRADRSTAGRARTLICVSSALRDRARQPSDRPDRRRRPHLPGPHLRLPDERARLRAARPGCSSRPAITAADRRHSTADVVVFNTCAVRENADNKLYGNLGPPGVGEGQAPRHADRGRRLPGAEGPQRDPAPGARGSTSSSARTTSGRCRRCWSAPGTTTRRSWRSSTRSRSSRRRCPAQARFAVLRLGVDLGGLQQHLHVLHRAVAARQGGRPPAGRHPGRGRDAGRGRRSRGDAARPERQLLRRRVRRPGGVRQAAAGLRRRSTVWNASGSPRRTRRTSPAT